MGAYPAPTESSSRHEVAPATGVPCDTALTPVRIGFVGQVSVHDSPLDGLQAYVEGANLEGGVGGRCVEVVVRDTRGQSLKAIEAVTELADSGIRAFVGPDTSDTVQATLSLAIQRKLVLVSPSATRANLTGEIPYFFRTIPSDALQGPAQASWAYETLGIRELAFLYEGNAYGAGLRDAFGNAYMELGGTILDKPRMYPTGGQDALSEAAEAVVALTPPAVVVEGVPPTAVNMIRALRDANYTGPIIASEALETRDALASGGDALEGVYYTKTSGDPQNPQFQALDASVGVEAFTIHGYDAGLVLVQTLRAHGPDATAEVMRQHILETPFEGTASADVIMFDAQGDLTEGGYQVWQIRDGAFMPTTVTG